MQIHSEPLLESGPRPHQLNESVPRFPGLQQQQENGMSQLGEMFFYSYEPPEDIQKYNPYHPCMEHLPTFGLNSWVSVHIPYMEHLGMVLGGENGSYIYIYIFIVSI